MKNKLSVRVLESLGHVMSEVGIRLDSKKIRIIREWEAPRTQKEIRSFLDLANYYQKFIRNFYKVVSPLSNILNEEAKLLMWDEACKDAFNDLKMFLSLTMYLSIRSSTKNLRYTRTRVVSR